MKDNNGVISLDQVRNRKQEEKKRKTERLFFHNLVGVYIVSKPGKLVPVDLIDVSEGGLGIQTTFQPDKPNLITDSQVLLRLYFSEESFMEMNVDIKNTRHTIEGGSRYLRYGCSLNSENRAYEAWKQFVSFLRAYSDISEKDDGNIGVGSY